MLMEKLEPPVFSEISDFINEEERENEEHKRRKYL